MQRAATTLTIKKPFGLFSTAISHGWYQTLPFRWQHDRRVLQRAEQLDDGSVFLVEMSEQRSAKRGHVALRIDIEGEGSNDPLVAREIAQRCASMLHADEDLRGFYALCAARPELASALRHGAGRCMRASTLFEDVVKTILGTNVVWKQAVVMINRLAELGDPCPADPTLRAWPTAAQIAKAGERYLRTRVRAGYRSPYIVELARKHAAGEAGLEEIEALAVSGDDEELYKALVQIKGVGKSSAHFLMNLLGHYAHISVDSATYAYAKRELFKGKRPTEKQIRRRFAEFGEWQSLVYWFARWEAQLAWWEDASGRSSA
jgi:3-methyladenine DNA glycosylase/8-oxoguanine DNA glycosylase